MADPVDTTGAPARASLPENPDPVVLLLQIWQRQFEVWRTLPAEADGLRNTVADISWGLTSTALASVRPTTRAGALLALRHVVFCLRRDHSFADSDYYPIPLAERALATLEHLTTA